MSLWVLALANGLAVFTLGATKFDWPGTRILTGYLLWAFSITTVAAVVQPLVIEAGERKRRKTLQLQDSVREYLSASLVVLVNECGAPFDKIGIQAFTTAGWWFRARHDRLAKIRLSQIPSSGIFWARDKGVIGKCWQTRREQWEDLDRPPFSQFANLTKERWGAADTRPAFNLTHRDYQTLGTKYGTVAAVPIVMQDRYIGCITLDTPPGVRLKNKHRAIQSLTTTADLVGRLIAR